MGDQNASNKFSKFVLKTVGNLLCVPVASEIRYENSYFGQGVLSEFRGLLQRTQSSRELPWGVPWG